MLGLFLAVIFGSVAAARRAATRFQALREPALALLSQPVVVAIAAMLAMLPLVSNGHDMRLWLLLALGPAFLAVAIRHARAREFSPEPAGTR